MESRAMNSKWKLSEKTKETWMGYFFIGPMILGVFVFSLFPILTSFYLSLTNWSFVTGLQNIHFNGIANFKYLFDDAVFLKSLRNNFILLTALPITLGIAMFLAIIINQYVYLKGFFKVVYFIPQISSVVAVAVVWQVIFHPTYGPVNNALKSLGFTNPPQWLGDPNFAMVSLIMLMVWIDLGYALIIYIAGLQDIPMDLYEAAELDGASWWDKFRKITFPMLGRTTFFLIVTGVIGTFKAFSLIKILTDGGPVHSTSVIVYQIYQSGFVDLKPGYASAMAVVLFMCVLIITVLQLFVQRKWVHDGG
jgi:multiple sugar transport system permease protein